jgi:MEMO1 family protein
MPDNEQSMEVIMEHFILVFLIILCAALSLESRTRKPAVSGRWYSSDPVELKSDIKKYLDGVKYTTEQSRIVPLGLIVPHAGYMFSGPVAAYCYKLLEGKQYDTVILLGSSHHYAHGIISIYAGDFLETPLGRIPVDQHFIKELLSAHEGITFDESIHAVEHSNEAQLPFLQYILDDFQVVSLLTSTNNIRLLEAAAHAISTAIDKYDKKVLLINSTDMSHFHSYDSAKQIDRRTIELILAEKWVELHESISYRECELCGYHAFEIFQRVMQKLGSDSPQLLNYANSGDAHPEYGLDEVVGYGAFVFPQKLPVLENPGDDSRFLDADDKKWLLSLARSAIKSNLSGETIIPPQPEKEILKEERAVFVTLHKNEQLRGCIGHMIAHDQLYKAVWDMALSAAFNDPRFAPVRSKELDDIHIEISILTPMQKIDSYEEIVMGRDGVMVQSGSQTGVFLPQVAKETGWDIDTFLRYLCTSKAMLPPDAYKDPQTELYVFQVEEFSD